MSPCNFNEANFKENSNITIRIEYPIEDNSSGSLVQEEGIEYLAYMSLRMAGD